MLGYETERRLKNFLAAISDGEQILEKARQRLCEIRDFAPHAAFQRFDRDANDYITSFELLNFLRDNGVLHATEGECHRLLRFFDSDEDGRLSYNDFIQMLLPCEDNFLRRLTQERPSYRVARYDYLPRDIERGLVDILERELDLLRRLDSLKADMEVRYDYSVFAAYKCIDKYNEGHINTYNLSAFLKNNGFYASERELLCIIRRIDTDGDAKLSYTEFSDFIKSHESTASRATELLRSYSAERTSANRLRESSYSSPLRQSTYASPARSHSAYRPRSSHHKSSALKASQLSASRRSPAKNLVSTLRLGDEDELVRALREQVGLEKELENAKIALVQRPDFNLFDAFRIFDIDSRGYITLSDLKDGLNNIGVFPSLEELELFVKRYDKNQDLRVKYSEFCDAFTPNDAYYASLLNRRTSNDARGRFYQRDDCFLGETRIEFKNVWRTHFKIETYSESLRQRLYKRPGFNLYEAFVSCDLNDNGFITRDELRALIESRGFYVSEKEVHNLIEKIDKDRDGRISYSEFKEEFQPRSPVRF